jgi:hypothetical protein
MSTGFYYKEKEMAISLTTLQLVRRRKNMEGLREQSDKK